MAKPECDPIREAIADGERAKMFIDRVIAHLMRALAKCEGEGTGGGGTPPAEEPPPEYPGLKGLYDVPIIVMPPGEEGP